MMDQVAWVIAWWTPTPVFHFSDYDGVSERRWKQAVAESGQPFDPARGPWKQTYAYCGLLLVDRGSNVEADPIPTRHAVRFGRPCKGCLRAMECRAA